MVYDALVDRRMDYGFDPRVEIAVKALKTCIEETGNGSKGSFTAWRNRQGDPSEQPTASFIHRAFGTWLEARRAVGDAIAPNPAAHRLHLLPEASDEQILQAVRNYGSSQPEGSLTLLGFAEYCTSPRASSQAGAQLPTSHNTVKRRLGKWPEILARAGLFHRRHHRRTYLSEAAILGPDISADKLLTLDYPYSEEDLVVWSRWLSGYLGIERFTKLTELEYHRLREEILELSSRSGLAIRTPSISTLRREPNGWAKFKARAGIAVIERQFANGTDGPTLIADQEIDRAIRRAASELGGNPTRKQYEQWARELKRRGEPVVSQTSRRYVTPR